MRTTELATNLRCRSGIRDSEEIRWHTVNAGRTRINENGHAGCCVRDPDYEDVAIRLGL